MTDRRVCTILALLLLTAWPADAREPLTPPTEGRIRVAIVLAEGAQVIDFAGPWEVFQDVHLVDGGAPGGGGMHAGMTMPFELFTVAASREPVRGTGGMKIVPDYTFDDAPQAHVIVVPALRGSPELHAWLRRAAKAADLTMSVCTGAFQLAATGLLDGFAATTHHDFLDAFAERYPGVKLERKVRWVDNGAIATAAGLTSGIDLALHVVARYFGDGVAQWTADYLEHASDGWKEGAGMASQSGEVEGG
jgi:transcriptional regulator GlxA family with amidase domain